jgi:translocation and assembly module TamB
MAARASPLLRRLAGLGLGLIATTALTLAGAWWWAGTEGSLATALRWAPWTALSTNGVSGSLRHGGQASRMAWQSPSLQMEATQVTLRWQAEALLSRRLHIEQLAVGSLLITPGTATPAPQAGPPTSLRLPLPLLVTLDDFSVGQLRRVGTPAFEATDLRGSYAYSNSRHQHALTLRQAQVASGRYSANVVLDADGPMALEASLAGALTASVPASTQNLPLRLQASAKGTLTDLQLQAELALDGALAAPATKLAPQASLKAQVQPWGAQALVDMQASFSQLDLARLWPQAPQTQLTGTVQVKPQVQAQGSPGEPAWRLEVNFQNTQPGPWDRGRLPVAQLTASGQWRGGQALLQSLDARLGEGRLQASGQWTAPGGSKDWDVDAQLTLVNPATIYAALPAQRLSGHATLQSRGPALSFDAVLKAAGAAAPAAATPTGQTTALQQWLGQLRLQDASARGSWLAGAAAATGGTLELGALKLRSADAALSASGRYQPRAFAGQGQLSLSAPGLAVTADGALSPDNGAGQLSVKAADAQRALSWLRGLPGLANPLEAAAARGRGQLSLAWQGGWRDPQLQASLDLPALVWQLPATARSSQAGTPLQLRDVQASVNGRLRQAQVSASGRAQLGARRFELALKAEGGAEAGATPRWQASVQQLQLSVQDPAWGPGFWRLASQGAFGLQGAAAQIDIGAGLASLQAPINPNRNGAANTAAISWQTARWQAGQVSSAGNISGIPLAWAELAGLPTVVAGAAGPLVFDGAWDAVIGPDLRFTAQLARSSGDLTLQAETTEGLPVRVAAGLRDARLSVRARGEALSAEWRWDSERAGTAEGQLKTRLIPAREGEAAQAGDITLGGWRWPADAAVSGQLRAQLPRIGAWSALAPPGWRLRGSLATQLSLSGTRSAPQLSGDLQASDLALRSVVDGIEFDRGRLRARFDGDRLRISEFSLQGAGANGSGGQLNAEGEAAWMGGAPQVRLKAQLQRLRASLRTDRQLTVSGQLEGKLSAAATEISGALSVDQAQLLLHDESRPELGDDVVLRNAAKVTSATAPPAGAARDARRTQIAVQIDLGQDFRVVGKGIDTRLRGVLALLGDAVNKPRLYGTLTTEGGQYRAYGQRLQIEEGVLRFGGPIDNPALDILAVRPNMSQRVGVQISGTALLPRVRLYAEPELPDAEKLAWLVLGRSSASGGAEAAVLQQAALALLGSKSGSNGMSGALAASLGLDELSLRAPSGSGASASAGAITLGKRFSSNFYAAYERSLSGTLGTLYLFYDLSQRFTVRAQSGEQTAIDLIFTVPYE